MPQKQRARLRMDRHNRARYRSIWLRKVRQMLTYHPWRVVATGLSVVLTAASLVGTLTGFPYPLALLAVASVLFALGSGLLDPVFRILSRVHPLRVVAFIGGCVLLGIDMTAVYTGMIEAHQPAYLIAGGLLMTACSGALDPLARFAWQHGHKLLAGLCWLMLPVALFQVISNALDRAGAARDAQMRVHEERAYRIELAQKELERAKQAESDARDKRDDIADRTAAECATGIGPNCRRLTAQLEKAEADLAKAEAAHKAAKAALAEIGPPTEDPRIKRLAALLPFLSKETIATYEPAVGPLGIPILGIVMLNVSLMPSRKSAERERKKQQKKAVVEPPKAKAPPRRMSPRKNPKVQALATGSVVQLRPKRS